VGKIAAAGKAIYTLPLSVNVALRDPLKPGTPGSYESGGPTDNVIPIWKVEARAIDVIGPDIYLGNTASYLKVLELYDRPDNALFVPETAGSPQLARFFFSVLGHHGIGYSPFGLDLTRNASGFSALGAGKTEPGVDPKYAFLEPTAENYRLIEPMMADVARLNFEGKLEATAEVEGEAVQVLHFKGWDAIVSYGGGRGRPAKGNPEPVGRALIAQLKDNQFLVTGYHAHVDFRPAPTEDQKKTAQIVVPEGQTPSIQINGKWQHRQFLRVEEGEYENGSFLFQRILNGDETDWGVGLGSAPTAMRVSVATY
jgi:beta-galactosidase GanA